MTQEEYKAKVRVIDAQRKKGTPLEDACKSAGIPATRYYYWKAKLGKAKPRKKPAKPFTPTQVVVHRDKKVNIVIMKGDQEVVQEIAKSLSWMGEME